MSSDSRGLTLIPPPRLAKGPNGHSELRAKPFRNLNPTRDQQQNLPENISLLKGTALTPSSDGYHLDITKSKIEIRAHGKRGWHYGLQTLKQIAANSKDTLPLIHIEDYPDFENRAIMLDVSRNKVPKLQTLFYLIDLFSSWKINELQLYIEHAFAYEGHETVWHNASPLTKEDIHILDTYCHDRYIELVPNLNCFGHMSRWLIHQPYNQLAEQPDGGNTDLGFREEPQGLCPLDPGSIKLAEDLIAQMSSCFQSSRINVGCDETIDLGYGRSKEAVNERGRGVVYLDYLKQVHALCESHGKQMQFWADILLRYPELINEIPSDGVALNWGYESIHPFERETELLGSSGTDFYVCPGTSSWNSLGGRTENMIGNIVKAASCGRENGAVGIMITDWGDNGHMQPLVSSFPGFVFGAAKAWNQNAHAELATGLDTYVFGAEGWGELILALGNLDQPIDIYIHNQSVLYKILHDDREEIKTLNDLKVDQLKDSLSQAKQLRKSLENLKDNQPTDPLLTKECIWVSDMLVHACNRGIAIIDNLLTASHADEAQKLREDHERIWHLRNRSGGYADSRKFFETLVHQ